MRIVVVPWLPPHKFAITIAPFVFIRRDKKSDLGIIAHELVHIRQVAAMGWWSFYWNYITNLPFRRSVEAEGYAKQREVENA